MKMTLSKSKNAEQVYITKSFRDENGKSTSRIFMKLGTMAELLPQFNNDRDEVLKWAREQALFYTEEEANGSLKIPIWLREGKQIPSGEQVIFSGGSLFLTPLFYELGLGKVCDKIAAKHSFKFDLASVLCGLVCARILSPSSKLSSFEYLQSMLDQPNFSVHDIYRALDVLDESSDLIQAYLYKNGKDKRKSSVLYYDCTNFFFEVETEDSFRRYGKSKEHRPNPIVQMGLFIDEEGLPLAFTVFPGNESEQPTLIPLEKRIMKDFALSKFIICTDAGLASFANRRFNDHPDRSFIVTQSLKQLKGYLKDWALDPRGWSLGNDKKLYDLSMIDTDEYEFKDSVFYKERWINDNGFEQRIIVSYSPKRKNYQRNIRSRQVERAMKIIRRGASSETKNPNNPKRFIKEEQRTADGEVADVKVCTLTTEKIEEEMRYDGFSAVCTTLEDSAERIVRINSRRWEIEESFRIMKSEFKSRPVYHRKEVRIRAHFLTCFLALMVFRTLEKKLEEKYTVSEMMSTLKGFNFKKTRTGDGYEPGYMRTDLTDALHDIFGFRTDWEHIPGKNMKKIIRDPKRQ